MATCRNGNPIGHHDALQTFKCCTTCSWSPVHGGWSSREDLALLCSMVLWFGSRHRIYQRRWSYSVALFPNDGGNVHVPTHHEERAQVDDYRSVLCGPVSEIASRLS